MSDAEIIMDDAVTLDKAEWQQIIQDLLGIGPVLQQCIAETVKKFPDITSELPAMDPVTFEADIRAACAAAAYVAEFAADKCQFIPVQEE